MAKDNTPREGTNGSVNNHAVEEKRVRIANEAFYAAFRAADFDAMNNLWSKTRSVAVYHPNWQGITGRDSVMASWYRIMVEGAPPEIFPKSQTVILNRNAAFVLCTEDMGGVQTIATNTFVLEDGQWRLTHHQATPLPVAAQDRSQET